MKATRLAVALACLVPSAAQAQLVVEADGRGVVEVKVGRQVYLTDVAVSVAKPGWVGDLADQRAVDPAEVSIRKEGATTAYVVPLKDPLPGVLIERIIRREGETTLEYDLIPDEGAELEAVVLRGSLKAAEHAGKTRYVVVGPEGERGVLPAELDAGRHVAWSGRPDWLGFEVPGAGALRVVPRDVRSQLQDDRKWSADRFSLLMTTSGGEVLPRKPIRFGATIRAEAAGSLAKESGEGAGRTPPGL